MSTKNEQNTNEQINTLFRKVVTMATVDAFDFLNSVKEPANIVEQVVKLLSDSETRTTFLIDNPDLGNILQPITAEQDLVGQSIGDIDLVKLLGKGGMGEVYLGEDKQLQRKVAVKTIRGVYRLNHIARDRFRREALILSKLDHANICKIYNILEIGDIDFLILEYIEGVTLNKIQLHDYSYQQKLKIAKALFAGLIVAHKEDIVHRDIKPDNIIIASSGGVKLLDFGISASLKHIQNNKGDTEGSQEFNSSTNINTTNPGTILGTLGYMSPEQAKGEEIRTASDIYSLGIIFHELFSGHKAHPKGISKDKLFERAQKGISEPLLNTPKDLAQLINRMKSPNPASRPTAIDGAEMLEKIINKPKRRIRQLLISAIILIAVLGFSKYTYDLKQQKLQADIARVEAEKAKQQSEQVTEFLESLFKVSNPYTTNGETITARQMLDDGANRINQELADQPYALVKLKIIIGTVYRQLALYSSSRIQYEEAETIFKSKQLKDPELEMGLLGHKALLEFETSHFDVADKLLQKTLVIAEENNLTENSLYFDSKFNLGVFQSRKGNFEVALTIYQELLDYYNKNTKDYGSSIVQIYNSMGLAYWRLEDLEKSEISTRKALSILESLDTENLQIHSAILGNLTNILGDMGKYDEALDVGEATVKIRQKLLGENHPDLALSYDNLSIIYYKAGNMDKCIELNGKALQIYQQSTGKLTQDYAMTLANRAAILSINDDFDGAEIALIEVLTILPTLHGQKHYLIADYLTDLGKIYHLQGELKKAKEKLLAATRMYEDINHPMKNRTVAAWQELVKIYLKEDDKVLILTTYKTILEKLQNEEDKDDELIEKIQGRIVEYSNLGKHN